MPILTPVAGVLNSRADSWMTMRILIISPNFFPEKTGIGVTATDCARFIAELGHDVTVLTAMPYYPEWEIHPEYRGKLFSTEQIHGCTVKRVWLYVPQRVVTWSRIAHELSFAALVFFRALFTPCDRILVISPPLSAAGMAVLVAKLRRKPLWSYVKDIQPDAAICLGMLRNPLLVRFSRWLEATLYRASEKVLVLSEGMARNIQAKGVPDSVLEVVPLSIDVDELARASRSPEAGDPQNSVFRAEFGLEDKFVALYSGNIGVKQNPEILVRCAELLQDHQEIFIAVVGEGAQRELISEQIRAKGLTNIGLYPLRERHLLGDMLSSVDALLATQRKEVLDIVMPSKLIAYLTSGRPVIASAHPDSEIAVQITSHRAGLVCTPESAEELVAAILFIKENPEAAQAMGEAGYQFVARSYDNEVVKTQYYCKLFGNPPEQTEGPAKVVGAESRLAE